MMPTVLSPSEQCIVLEHSPWAVYEAILAAHQKRSVPPFTYDQGRRDIMSPSLAHAELTHRVRGLSKSWLKSGLSISVAVVQRHSAVRTSNEVASPTRVLRPRARSGPP